MSFQISATVLLEDVQIKLAEKEQEILILESQKTPLPEVILRAERCKINNIGRIVCSRECANCAQRSKIIDANRRIDRVISPLRQTLDTLKQQENLLINQVELNQKRIFEEQQFERETQFLLKEQELLSERQFTTEQEIGDITLQLPKVTPENNTLRNALIIGGALLLVL